MHIKLHRSGPRTYLRIVEAYRDSGKVKHRTIATLGRLEDVGPEQVDSLINGLLRATGRAELDPDEVDISALPALEFGPCWLLTELWRELGLDVALQRALRSSRRAFDAEALTRVMVFNRLCDPESKLGLLRWLEGVRIPEINAEQVTHQRLLRAMDALADARPAIEDRLESVLLPLIDTELSLVFYDLTTIRVHGQKSCEGDIRRFGLSKEVEGIARQCVLGLVQTADGIPLSWEVFAGNTPEVSTLVPMLERVLERFAIKRVIVVADRGLLSLANIEQIRSVTLPDGGHLEFILAVSARRYGDMADRMRAMDFDADQPSVREAEYKDEDKPEAQTEPEAEPKPELDRLVVAHDPVRAAEQRERRRARINELLAEGMKLAARLNAQDEGRPGRGRRSTDHGAYLSFSRKLIEAELTRFISADERDGLFSFAENPEAIAQAEQLDGKLVLRTNVKDLSAQQIVASYKALADIERSFRVLKSEIDIAPMFHRLPGRIEAHAMVCFLALLLNRVMRLRLRAADSALSPQRALSITKAIQWFRVKVGRSEKTGVTLMDETQRSVFEQLELALPK